MNKILSLLLIACGASTFVACSDDTENPYDHTSSISVVSSNVSFTARASQGVVRVSLAEGGSVVPTVGADWCTAVVAGDSVVVSVTQNSTLSGRSTMLTLHNGADSTQVPVTQDGVIAQLENNGVAFESDDAQTQHCYLRSNIDLTVTSAPDWLTASISGDSLIVTATANTSGLPRKGYVKYGSGDFADSALVTQADFDADIAGTYNLHYSTASGRQRYLPATVTSTGMTITSLRLTVPMTYDPYTGSFTIESGQYLGMNSGNYIYFAFATEPDEDGRYYWTGYNTGLFVSAPLEVAEDGTITATFAGDLSGYAVARLLLRNFTAQRLDSQYDSETNLLDMYYPYLQRNPAGAKPSSLLR